MEIGKVIRWDPKAYAQSSQTQLRWATELLRRLCPRGDEAVLDIGCGDGKVSAEIARTTPRGFILGIDSSPEMIAHASEAYPPSRFPNIRFQVMDACNLVLDRSFDVAFSNAALHWVHDHPAMLLGTSRALRPGGRLVFSFGGRGNARAIVEVLDSLIGRSVWRPFFDGFEFPWSFLGLEEYAAWLPAAGLEATRLKLVEKDTTHESLKSLADWFRTTWMPYTHRVPDTLREQFIREALDAYVAAHPLDSSARPHVRMVRLEVEAFKAR